VAQELLISDSTIEHLFYSFNGYELSYSYKGDFNQKLTDSILSLSETNMDVAQEPLKHRKKIYFIMVESLQNITRHQDSDLLEGFFSIHKTPSGFLITSGNVIENEEIPGLVEKLEKVNSLNPEELKKYYYEVLNSGVFSTKGGAGLGLIEMSRKSGNKLLYDFVEINKDYSFFYFQNNIRTSIGEQSNAPLSANSLDLAKNVHKLLTENKVKLFFHGRFEKDSLQGLISMTETTISANVNSPSRKVIVEVMIEMLRNICLHGVDELEESTEKPGLILISEDAGRFYMITGNYIDNSKVAEFQERIDEVNMLSNEELNKLAQDHNMDDNLQRGFGLLGLRLKTRNKIEISLLNRSVARSFLIMKTQIEA
jgi:hypothetical protein